MQLDNTKIAVKERSLLDTFDIALHVTLRFAIPTLLLFACGAIPLAILNWFLLSWMLDTESSTFFYIDEFGTVLRFLWCTSILITLEAPLASVFATGFLGQALFLERPNMRQIVLDAVKLLPQVLWSQLIIRGLLIAVLLLLSLDRELTVTAAETLGLGSVALYSLALRYWRPFINEIILLERNPLISRDRSTVTVGRRSYRLHGPSSGDLFFRGLGTSILGILLSMSFFGTFLFMSGVFLNDWQPGPFAISVICPASMWLVAWYLTTVRFLNYLDVRIRQEGWEVELRMRAEAERLARQLERGLA